MGSLWEDKNVKSKIQFFSKGSFSKKENSASLRHIYVCMRVCRYVGLFCKYMGLIFVFKKGVGFCVTTSDTKKILKMEKISYLLNTEVTTPSDEVSDYSLICI